MDISAINSANAMSQAIFHMNNRRPAPGIDWENISEDDAAILHAAKEFEAYFLHMMFRAMRATVDTSRGILPQSQSEEIFRDMLDEQVARTAAEGGGIGLAQQIFRQMTAGRNVVQEALIYNGVYGGVAVHDEVDQ